MITRRLSFVGLVLAAGAVLGGCPLRPPETPTAQLPLPPEPAGQSTFVAGTFEGNLTIGRTRVRAAKDTTELYVAKLGGPAGNPQRLRAFSGMARERSISSVPLRDGIIVLGVVRGEMELDGGKKLSSPGRDALVFLRFDGQARLQKSAPLAYARSFHTPDVAVRGRTLGVRVPYRGPAQAGGKDFPEAPDSTLLLQLSDEGDLTSVSGASDPTQQQQQPKLDPTGARRPTGAFWQADGLPPSYKLAFMQGCDVCKGPGTIGDPACSGCRTTMCGPDGVGRCCSSGWDGYCMQDALIVCPGSVCSCQHSPWADGIPMLRQCSSGTRQGCCSNIVGADSFCRQTWWDGICVSSANSHCGGC